ncbi:unnamed protein product [Sphagnum troendelagicum]|uniref:C2H2-type domain-containing protein n=1 Tax=Sphagnum troendelagicum TaxID=128251 RepID=A0ABP0TMI4_9BRYO
MPGRCFSWTKSLSFKALSSNSKSSDSANICRDDSQSGSFSSIALKGGDSSSSIKRSRTSSCGCTASMVSRCSPPMIPNLRDVIIHGSSKLLLLQSSKAQSAASTASSSSSPRKSDSYIHQSQTGEYYYRAPLKSKHAAGNNNHHKLQLHQLVDGAGSSKGLGSGNNMCLVRGCCECSMQASCSQISPELVADQSFPTIRGSATSTLIHSVGALHGSTSPKCVCTKCGEAFHKPEALELHQISRHAVSQLGSGNSSLNVVEIIFRTSWLTKETPCGKIERILKIDNTQRAISEFEKYRNKVKERHAAGTSTTSDLFLKNKTSTSTTTSHDILHDERCLADGNELLRFFATSLSCSLGANSSSSSLCSMKTCNVCSVIRWGFGNSNKKQAGGGSGNQQQQQQLGIYTTATSGKAHQLQISQLEEKENRTPVAASLRHGKKHAMLVCRVIAGRIQKLAAGEKMPPFMSLLPLGYDSVATDCGPTANLDEVTVFDPKAVLPCFVVIYTI